MAALALDPAAMANAIEEAAALSDEAAPAAAAGQSMYNVCMYVCICIDK
jgi:hypothetical protein